MGSAAIVIRAEGGVWAWNHSTMINSGDPGVSWLRLGGDQPEIDFCLYQGRRVVTVK